MTVDTPKPSLKVVGKTDAEATFTAEEAVRTLLRFMGEDPTREGLADTPARVVRAYQEWFSGYKENPADFLARTFTETGGYGETVLLRGATFTSFCEHHMAPIRGVAHIAYLPDRRIVGISKLQRVLNAFAQRLQVQERLTAQIADTIEDALKPRGVAVLIEAEHFCMTTRGVHADHDVRMVTSRLSGVFQTDSARRAEFYGLLRSSGSAPSEEKQP